MLKNSKVKVVGCEWLVGLAEQDLRRPTSDRGRPEERAGGTPLVKNDILFVNKYIFSSAYLYMFAC